MSDSQMCSIKPCKVVLTPLTANMFCDIAPCRVVLTPLKLNSSSFIRHQVRVKRLWTVTNKCGDKNKVFLQLKMKYSEDIKSESSLSEITDFSESENENESLQEKDTTFSVATASSSESVTSRESVQFSLKTPLVVYDKKKLRMKKKRSYISESGERDEESVSSFSTVQSSSTIVRKRGRPKKLDVESVASYDTAQSSLTNDSCDRGDESYSSRSTYHNGGNKSYGSENESQDEENEPLPTNDSYDRENKSHSRKSSYHSRGNKSYDKESELHDEETELSLGSVSSYDANEHTSRYNSRDSENEPYVSETESMQIKQSFCKPVKNLKSKSRTQLSDCQMCNIKPCRVLLTPLTVNMCSDIAPCWVVLTPIKLDRRQMKAKRHWTVANKCNDGSKIYLRAQRSNSSDRENECDVSETESIQFQKGFWEDVKNLKPKRRTQYSNTVSPVSRSGRSIKTINLSEDALMDRCWGSDENDDSRKKISSSTKAKQSCEAVKKLQPKPKNLNRRMASPVSRPHQSVKKIKLFRDALIEKSSGSDEDEDTYEKNYSSEKTNYSSDKEIESNTRKNTYRSRRNKCYDSENESRDEENESLSKSDSYDREHGSYTRKNTHHRRRNKSYDSVNESHDEENESLSANESHNKENESFSRKHNKGNKSYDSKNESCDEENESLQANESYNKENESSSREHNKGNKSYDSENESRDEENESLQTNDSNDREGESCARKHTHHSRRNKSYDRKNELHDEENDSWRGSLSSSDANEPTSRSNTTDRENEAQVIDTESEQTRSSFSEPVKNLKMKRECGQKTSPVPHRSRRLRKTVNLSEDALMKSCWGSDEDDDTYKKISKSRKRNNFSDNSDDEYDPLGDDEFLPERVSYRANASSSNIPLSDYEKQAQLKMKEKLALLKSLNINEVTENFCDAVKKLKPKPRTLLKTKILPVERSHRSIKTINLSEDALIERCWGPDEDGDTCKKIRKSRKVNPKSL